MVTDTGRFRRPPGSEATAQGSESSSCGIDEDGHREFIGAFGAYFTELVSNHFRPRFPSLPVPSPAHALSPTHSHLHVSVFPSTKQACSIHVPR
jgi:hypothetical protein